MVHIVLTFFSFLLAGAALLLLAVWLGGSATVWWRRPWPRSPAKPPAEDLTLTTPDGKFLAATYRPGKGPDGPGLIIQHGIYDSRQKVAANAEWLAAQGFAVLTFDFRGHGQSSPAPHSFGLTESIDARTALDWLKRRLSGAPVGIIGISLGGAACLIGSGGPLAADALVLQAVYPDIKRAVRNRLAIFLPRFAAWLEPLLSYQSVPRFGVWPQQVAPVESLKSYKRPVFIIGGEEDRYTPPNETRELFEAAAEPKFLLLLGGLNHPETAAVESDEYRQKILDFLSTALGARQRDR